jgi:hypothetical protein
MTSTAVTSMMTDGVAIIAQILNATNGHHCEINDIQLQPRLFVCDELICPATSLNYRLSDILPTARNGEE